METDQKPKQQPDRGSRTQQNTAKAKPTKLPSGTTPWLSRAGTSKERRSLPKREGGRKTERADVPEA